jgi:hypothetical protein
MARGHLSSSYGVNQAMLELIPTAFRALTRVKMRAPTFQYLGSGPDKEKGITPGHLRFDATWDLASSARPQLQVFPDGANRSEDGFLLLNLNKHKSFFHHYLD